MQHILNIAFDFDDERVRNTIEEQACKQVISTIEKDILTSLSKYKNGYSFHMDSAQQGVLKLVSEKIDSLVEQYKDEIIQAASKELAAKLVRTKVAKEAIASAVRDGEN